MAKIASQQSQPVDKVRLNVEKFVWSSPRKMAKEKNENSDAMRTLTVERR
jgi:hypothetical protein